MAKGRPKYEYLVFDLPSDHEVEHQLATESATIESVVHNKRLGGRLKRICMASEERFLKKPNYKVNVAFVHLACHGNATGIGLIGGIVPWAEAVSVLTSYLHPLLASQQRVMVFSCCHAVDGLNATRADLAPFFTGVYFLKQPTTPFSVAITAWSMFYLKKDFNRPHARIAREINTFLGEEIVGFEVP